MSAALLDANVLIALATPEHFSQGACTSWINSRSDSRFATCALTEGALLRFVLRVQARPSMTLALDLLAAIQMLPGHFFIEEAPSYREAQLSMVRGHKQLTDAYLASIARRNDFKLVTLDAGLAALHGDVCLLLRG